MKKLLLPLVAAVGLAIPTSALAWGGGHDHHGDFHSGFAGMFAKLSGTGTSFAASSATATGSIVAGNDHPNGHFSATLSNTGAAKTKTFTDNDGDADDGTITISCAPSTATITLTNGTTTSATYTGKTCSISRNGTMTKAGFFGRSSTGSSAFLKEDGTTVRGAVFSGGEGFHMGVTVGAKIGFGHHH